MLGTAFKSSTMDHTVPGCSTLAKGQSQRSPRRGRKLPHQAEPTVVSQEWWHQGGDRHRGGEGWELMIPGDVSACADPWGCECPCLTGGCWVSGQPSPQMVHYSAPAGAQEHLQVRHFCQKQSLILLIPWLWDGALCARWAQRGTLPSLPLSSSLAL